jgi:hypothetical protein
MMGMDIDRYVNNFNRGCKVISFGKPLCDVNGMEEQLNKNVQYSPAGESLSVELLT